MCAFPRIEFPSYWNWIRIAREILYSWFLYNTKIMVLDKKFYFMGRMFHIFEDTWGYTNLFLVEILKKIKRISWNSEFFMNKILAGDRSGKVQDFSVPGLVLKSWHRDLVRLSKLQVPSWARLTSVLTQPYWLLPSLLPCQLPCSSPPAASAPSMYWGRPSHGNLLWLLSMWDPTLGSEVPP